MSEHREEIIARYAEPDGGKPKAIKVDFYAPNNPFSQKPLEHVVPSDQKSKNSGGTAHILPAERAKAAFDVETMMNIIDGGAKKTKRRKFFKNFMKQYDDGMDRYFLSRPEVFYLSMLNWHEVHEDFIDDFSIQPDDFKFMTATRIHGGGPGAHYGIFCGPIMQRGSPQQVKEFGARGLKMKIVGGYAQTELGHGSNVRGIETTAHYDKNTQEFILNTPDLTSTKWWISNLGKLSTHALVYAQLIIDGKEYGINEFICQIRDENHRPLPGVEVGDCGDKLGRGAGDTGFLRLDNVRVPLDRMLCKYQQVTPDGKYVKNPKKRNPYAHYFTMLITRAGIVRGAAMYLARAVTIAVRYNAVRHQGFVNAEQGISYKSEERCVLDYEVQRYRVFKQLAQTYCFLFGGRYLGKLFSGIKDIGENVELVKTASATTSAMKSLCTLATLDGIEDLRKCCGGHGYHMISGVAPLLTEYMPHPTFEGDWVVLYLQTARYLVKTVQELKESGNTPEGQIDYLRPEYAENPEIGATPDNYKDPAFLHRVLKHRARNNVLAACSQFRTDMSNGLSWGDAWSKNGIILVSAAKAHGISALFGLFDSAVQGVEDVKCRTALNDLVLMYGLQQIVHFDSTNVLVASHQNTAGVVAIGDVMRAIRPNAVALVDAFDFNDSSLGSALGKEDGNVYEALWEGAQRSQLNQADPYYGYEKTLKPYLDREFLKKGNTPLKSSKARSKI